MTSANDFKDLDAALDHGGPAQLLADLVTKLRAEQRHHELFDVLLMQARERLGLPMLLSSPIDELPEPTRGQLEEAYLSVCREVGSALLSEGKLREAWPYLRPVGDRELVRAGLARIEPNDENLPALIEIYLHEGLDVARGYQLVIDHYGTCNAISTFDGVIAGKPIVDQRAAAARIVGRLHGELIENLKADIERREGATPAASSVLELVAGREWLFEENNYHIDTTHLASTLRFARLLDDAPSLRLALDLAEYGRRLSSQFQFASEEPFVDAYASHALFFAAPLGEQVDEAIAYFRQRAEQGDQSQDGTAAVEIYIALLARLGRHQEAIDAAATLIAPGARTTGFAPSLMELSRAAGDYRRLMQVCLDRGDVVGYSAGLIEQAKLGG